MAALWKDDGYGPDATLALYRRALHDAIERRELWLRGLITKHYKQVLTVFGHDIVQRVGEPVAIEGEGATEHAVIHPVFIDPRRLVGILIREARIAHARNDQLLRHYKEMMAWTMLDDLDWNKLPTETAEDLRKVLVPEIVRPNRYQGDDVLAARWAVDEAGRLESMDSLLERVALADLGPVFAALTRSVPAQSIRLLDIGAGSGLVIERLCNEAGGAYYALDVNEQLLAARSTDPSRKILGRAEAIGLPDGSFDVTFSRAVTPGILTLGRQ